MNVYQITVVPKSSGKDESHNKLHFCTFCKDTNFANFAKHQIETHLEEEEVQFINLHVKKTKKRNEMISLLKERGNHDMNMKTIKAEEGMFVPNRRVSPGGGNKNRKRPSPRNQDEKENQPKYQMKSDDEDEDEDSKSKKKNPKNPLQLTL